MLQFFRQMWQRLWGRLRYCGAVHYLAGGPSLPPPLTPEQEKVLLCPYGCQAMPLPGTT